MRWPASKLRRLVEMSIIKVLSALVFLGEPSWAPISFLWATLAVRYHPHASISKYNCVPGVVEAL